MNSQNSLASIDSSRSKSSASSFDLNEVKEKMLDGYDQVREKAEEVTQATQETIRQYPLAFLAGAFVLGFVVARLGRKALI